MKVLNYILVIIYIIHFSTPLYSVEKDTEIGTILQDVGQYDVPKFPWFPVLLNIYLGLMIEFPARFIPQKGGYETVNQSVEYLQFIIQEFKDAA